MEPLFTNTCEHTVENYTDALKAIVKRKKLVFKYVSIFLGAFAIFRAIAFHEYQDILLFAAFVLLEIYTFKYRLEKAAKVYFENNTVLHHVTGWQEIHFFTDGLKAISHPSNGESTPYYGDITLVVKTKRLYVLALKRTSFIMLDLFKFEKTTQEEFEQFIREKAVNATFIL